jgi:RNA polymerase sigma-70 factor (ECF subfamily)
MERFSESSDAELLGAVADGDEQALRALHDRHAPWLAARLRGRCSDVDVVQDALQETFVAVWKSAGRFRGSGEAPAWMWGIAIRVMINGLRSQNRHRTTFSAQPTSQTVVAAEETVLLGVEYGDLGSALESLSPEFHAVIRATVLDGLSTKEASQLLDIPEGTVKSRSMRARAQLRARLSEETT